MSIILCLVTTFLITSIHAGHKRVVIRVPQKTKYIHHHTVKKVPIYVLLPEKKPKILEALEEAKPLVRSPCKDLYGLPSVREDTSGTQARNRYEKPEREKPRPEWAEDLQNRGSYYINAVDTSYRTIDEHFLPPPLTDFDDLPFRRINTDADHKSLDSRQQRGHEEYNSLDSRQQRGREEYKSLESRQQRGREEYKFLDIRPQRGREEYKQPPNVNSITFTYPPQTENQDQDYTSFQYSITH